MSPTIFGIITEKNKNKPQSINSAACFLLTILSVI